MKEQQKNIRLIKSTIEARRKELKEVYHLDEVKILQDKLVELKRRNKSLDKELTVVKSELGKQNGLLEEIKEAKSSVTGIETPNAPAIEKNKQDLAEIRSETHMLKEKKRDLDREVEAKHKLMVDKQKALRELKGKLKEKKRLGDKDPSAIIGEVTQEDVELIRSNIELIISEKKTGTEQFHMDLRTVEEQKQILLEDKIILEAALSTKAKELRAVALKCKEFLRVSRYRNHLVPQSARETSSNRSTQTRLIARKEAHERKVQSIREREENERELIEAKLKALSALYEKGSQNQDTMLKMREDMMGTELVGASKKSAALRSEDDRTADFMPTRIRYLKQSEENQPINSVASEKGSSFKAKTGTVNDPFDEMMHSQFDSKGDIKKPQSNQANIKSSGMSFGPGAQKGVQLGNKLGQQSKTLTNSTPPQANIRDSNNSDPQALKREALPLPKIIETNQSGHNSQVNDSKRSQQDDPVPPPKVNLRPMQPSTALNESSQAISLKQAQSQHSIDNQATRGPKHDPVKPTTDQTAPKPAKQMLPPTLAQSEVTDKPGPPPKRMQTTDKEDPLIEFVPINQGVKAFMNAKPTSSMLDDSNSPKTGIQGQQTPQLGGDVKKPTTVSRDEKVPANPQPGVSKQPGKDDAVGKPAPGLTGSSTNPAKPGGTNTSNPEVYKDSSTSGAANSKHEVPAAKTSNHSNPSNSKGAVGNNDSDYVNRTTTLKPKKIQDETVYDGEDDDDLSQGTVVPVKPVINQNDSFNMFAQNVRGMGISQIAGKTSENQSQPLEGSGNQKDSSTKDIRGQNSAHGNRAKVTFNENVNLGKNDQSGELKGDRSAATTNLPKDKKADGGADHRYIDPKIADSEVFEANKDRKQEPVIDFLAGAPGQRRVTQPGTILSNSEKTDSQAEVKPQTQPKPPAQAHKPILSEDFLANPDAGGNGKPYPVDKPAPFKLSFKPKPA